MQGPMNGPCSADTAMPPAIVTLKNDHGLILKILERAGTKQGKIDTKLMK